MESPKLKISPGPPTMVDRLLARAERPSMAEVIAEQAARIERQFPGSVSGGRGHITCHASRKIHDDVRAFERHALRKMGVDLVWIDEFDTSKTQREAIGNFINATQLSTSKPALTQLAIHIRLINHYLWRNKV